MLRLSIRNLLVSKLRLFLTVAAVTVGVSFVSGTFVLSDTMGKAFDELYAGLTSGTDVVVRSEAAFEADIATTGGQVRPSTRMVDDGARRPGSRTRPRGGDRLRARPGQGRRADPARRRPDVRRQRRRHAVSPATSSTARVARRLGRTRWPSTRAPPKKAGFRARRPGRRGPPGRPADLHPGRHHRLRRDRQPAGRHHGRVRPPDRPAAASTRWEWSTRSTSGRRTASAPASSATGSPAIAPRRASRH